MEILLLYLFVALFFSFLCSMLESVILSVTPSFVNMAAEQNFRWGKLLKKFKDHIDRPLAAILTLNTFAHTVGAAGVGAQAQRIWGDAYLSITSAILTLMILIFSEIIPKTLGANYWRRLVPFTTYTLLILIFSPLYPFILLSQFITRLLRSPQKNKDELRQELSALARYGMAQGAFQQKESLIVENLMRFNHVKVREIMTPRVVVTALPDDMKIRDFYRKLGPLKFSRLPVYQSNKENVTGYVLKDDIMKQMLDKQYDTSMGEIKRNITVVVENTALSKLYESLLEKKEMIALVVDEYGGMAGIVSMEDIVETILGMEIVDERDDIEDMQELAMRRMKTRWNGVFDEDEKK